MQRTLEQELLVLLRGLSRECLVCGAHAVRSFEEGLLCRECGSSLRAGTGVAAELQCVVQAG